MGTADLSYLLIVPFTCRQAFTETQKFRVLSTVSFNCRHDFIEIRELHFCRYHSSYVDKPTTYQSVLVRLEVIFWVRFGFHFVLFLFLYFSFLVREVFFFYLPM